MTDHTREPWTVSPSFLTILGDPKTPGYDDVTIIAECEVDDPCVPPPNQQEANAARIVACVNACAGIPTEQLGNMKALIDFADGFERYCGSIPAKLQTPGLKRQLLGARAALAPFQETKS